MNKQKFVKYLWQLWEQRNTAFDNLWSGAGHKLKAGYTCRFRKKDCRVEFTGTVMYSTSRCAYVVISNGGRKPYITYLKDVYPVGVSVHWTEYYGDLLKGIESDDKACGECQWYDCQHLLCVVGGDVEPTDCACEEFIAKTITYGDKIRQGGDDALIDFADGIRRRMCHYCAYSKDKSCVDKTGDCWEGVRAWLNSPAESDNIIE